METLPVLSYKAARANVIFIKHILVVDKKYPAARLFPEPVCLRQPAYRFAGKTLAVFVDIKKTGAGACASG
jgi:hypothetical protein